MLEDSNSAPTRDRITNFDRTASDSDGAATKASLALHKDVYGQGTSPQKSTTQPPESSSHTPPESSLAHAASGVGHVLGDLAIGGLHEFADPGKLAKDVMTGVGLGAAFEALSLCPPLAAAVGTAAGLGFAAYGAYELHKHGSDWLHDISVDYDREHHSANEVAKARAGVQDLGEGVTSTVLTGGVSGVSKKLAGDIIAGETLPGIRQFAVDTYKKLAPHADPVLERAKALGESVAKSGIAASVQAGVAQVGKIQEQVGDGVIKTHKATIRGVALAGTVASNEPSDNSAVTNGIKYAGLHFDKHLKP